MDRIDLKEKAKKFRPKPNMCNVHRVCVYLVNLHLLLSFILCEFKNSRKKEREKEFFDWIFHSLFIYGNILKSKRTLMALVNVCMD